jgi:hypothetical protein
MKLPTKLEKTFTTYISKSQKANDMMPITQASRNVADALGRQAYGKSIKELDATVTNTITHLYAVNKMSVNEIASVMQLEVEFITSILKKYKLVKK